MRYKAKVKPKTTIQVLVKKPAEKPSNTPGTVHQKNDGVKPGKKPYAKKENKIAFVTLELTHNDPNATIIQMNKVMYVKGKTIESSFIYSNDGTPISPEATKHHGLSEYDVRYKRKISEFNIKREDFYVVWDGLVVKTLFWVNKVEAYPRLINLHLLTRFFTDNRNPVRMIDFASKCTDQSVEELKELVKTPLNKTRILPEIYKQIQKISFERYGVDTPEFFAKLSKARKIDDVPVLLGEYLAKKKQFEEKRKKFALKRQAKVNKKVDSNAAI